MDLLSDSQRSTFRKLFERETGERVPWTGNDWDYRKLFEKGELRDVLDAITIVYRAMRQENSAFSGVWHKFVERVMHEESVGYRLDAACVVHYHIDEEFERSRVSALSALDAPRLGGVRAAFEDAYRHLDSDPRDTKAAVRSIFEAIESLAKIIVPGAERLTRNLCVQKLKEACMTASPGDATEREVLGNLFISLGYWVDAVHDYRHGQASEQRVAPTEETTVLILSEGTAFLRQLALSAARMP